MTSKRHRFKKSQVKDFRAAFEEWDSSKDSLLDTAELGSAMKILGDFSQAKLDEIVQAADINGDGVIDFDEFLAACWEAKSSLKTLADKQVNLIQVRGAGGGSVVHTYAQEEMSAFAEHINYVLGEDPDLSYLMPVETEGMDLCTKISDGTLLCKFINEAEPNTIDMRAVNKRKGKKTKPLSLFQVNENNNIVVEAAKSIGVKVTNIGASDLREGAKKPHLVLGMIWQLVKIQLLSAINLKEHPELIRLLRDDETLADLLKMPAEKLLLRWFNYHLKEAGHKRRVKNFGKDVQDSECYTILLNHINPAKCDKKALNMTDQLGRAGQVLKNAKNCGVKVFIKPKDIVGANERLNLAFTASVFNHMPGLDPITEEEEANLAGMMEDDVGDMREERAFRMWINTLGIGDVYINNLFDDCSDGLVLLKVLNKLKPGIVSWKKVEKRPKNKFKKIANCNYVVVLGKSLKYSLVATGGSDIVDKNKKLILGLVWQMMRMHTIDFLNELGKSKGVKITDEYIVEWANKQVKMSTDDNGRECNQIGKFNDSCLRDGNYLIDLLAAVSPKIIDWEIVTEGVSDEDALLNARYAISIARKLGATIFLLPEDIVEVRSKMIMTFIAAVMMVALQ